MSLNQVRNSEGISETIQINLICKVDGTGVDRTIPVTIASTSSCVSITIRENVFLTDSGSYYQANLVPGSALAKKLLPRLGLTANDRRLVVMPGNVNATFTHLTVEIDAPGSLIRFYNMTETSFTSFRFYQSAQCIYML